MRYYHVRLSDLELLSGAVPLPDNLVGLAQHSLDDLTWCDGLPDLSGTGYWPERLEVPDHDPARQAAEPQAPVVDGAERVVRVPHAVRPLSAEEIGPLTVYQFLQLLTVEERIAVRGSTDPIVVDFIDLLGKAQEVRLDDSATRAGLAYVELRGLIAPGRAERILSGLKPEPA